MAFSGRVTASGRFCLAKLVISPTASMAQQRIPLVSAGRFQDSGAKEAQISSAMVPTSKTVGT